MRDFAYLKKIRATLQKYFEGKSVSFDLQRLDWASVTNFERRILRALAATARGKVITYSGLARKAGYPNAARAVGAVMRKNQIPIILPCHRVVPKGGGVGNYSQGIHWKKYLLKLEGVKGI